MFYTRLPVPGGVRHSAEILNRSRQYFPTVGVIVGAVSAAVLLAGTAVWTTGVAVVPAMMASVLVTGAFHEDGLADSFDGFGASRQPERIMAIMKDSRVGTYGVVGLALVLLLKYASLVTLSAVSVSTTALVILNAHVFSRLAASTVADVLPYARDLDARTSADGSSKIKPIADQPLPVGARVLSIVPVVPGAVALALADPGAVLALAVAAAGVGFAAVSYLRRRLGGYTGDCLGAAQQLAEVSGYGAAAAALL